MKHLIHTLTLMGCALALAQDTPTPPNGIPPVLPEYQLGHRPLPDARDLYQRTLDCWPAASRFRAELSLEGRLGPRHTPWLDTTGLLGTSTTAASASLVARLPLYAPAELDREREREWLRRRRAAEAVGQLIAHLADRMRIEQELGLMKNLEKRSRLRVLSGIAESQEQVHYMERVADLDGQRLRHNGMIERARLELLGFCEQSQADQLDHHLKEHLQ